MQNLKTVRNLKIVSALFIGWLLSQTFLNLPSCSGMEQACEYSLAITGRIPVFALTSTSRNKPQQLHGISIAEFGDGNKFVQTVWLIRNQLPGQNFINELTYGSPPAGWLQSKTALPIKDHTFYRFNSDYYFRRERSGSYTILSKTQFIDHLEHPRYFSQRMAP